MSVKHRTLYLLAPIVVVGLLLAGVLVFSPFSGPGRWYCSPDQPRPSGTQTWVNAMAPALPPAEPDQAFFNNFTVSSDDKSFTIRYPGENPPDNAFTYELRRMEPGERLDIGGGTLTFCAMGAAYLDATQTMAEDAAYRFYDARQRPITKEQAKELGTHRFTQMGTTFRHSPFPAVQFGFEHERVEDVMFHGIRIFDASTRIGLSSGYSGSGSQGHYWFGTHIPLWHRAPVDIVLDVSYGPSKTFEFAPRAGEGFTEGSFECRLLAVLQGVDTGYSSSSTRDDTVTHTFRKAQSDKAGLRFVFACQPTANKMPVSFEFLDIDGNKVRAGGSSTSGFIHGVNVKQSLEQVALIRARYRTQRRRIMIHLPYIPGLPEENNAIDDLFDLRIPYVRLHDASQVSEFLRKTLQLKASRRTGPAPSDSINSIRFPLEFSNVTIREILRIARNDIIMALLSLRGAWRRSNLASLDSPTGRGP